jgi:hypothetical protein
LWIDALLYAVNPHRRPKAVLTLWLHLLRLSACKLLFIQLNH